MVVMRHRGRWTLEDRFTSVWQYLPVDVPPGASGLRAELEYDRSAATTDLGCLGPAGVRGWGGRAALPCVVSAAGDRIVRVPGEEVTTIGGHAGALGDVGWIDFREPADSWLAATETRGGLLSINHPIGGHVSWTIPMTQRPPLIEVWHWSWL